MIDGNKTKPDPNFLEKERKNANPTIINDLFNQGQSDVSPRHSGTMPDLGIFKDNRENQPREVADPLAGFLVSFSRKAQGEYWPLHYGNNLIGSGSNAKIVLGEQRVSGEHANISVWTDEENSCLYVQVVDRESKNGTYLNGKKVLKIGQGIQLKNGDRVGIGEYELYLVIVDRFVLNLHKNHDFKEKGVASDYSNQYFSPNQ